MAKHIHIHVGTKDAELTPEQFQARATQINRVLTEAGRQADALESLASRSGDAQLRSRAEKLVSLIDAAARYAFSIR